MKYRNILYLIFATMILSFIGCEKDYVDDSRITYYADFTMDGDAEIFLNVGDAFTEPGIKAEENGQELPVETSVVGDYFGGAVAAVDTDTPDKYVINYSAENSDGYSGGVSRTVYVVSTGDLTTNIEGLYSATVVRNGSASPQYTDMQYVMIQSAGGGVYNISDAIGGYYDMGRGYGSAYRAQGMSVTANDIGANDFTYSGTIGVGAFGGALDMTAFSVDAGAGTISFTTEWSFGYVFEVTLTQIQL